MDDGRDYNAKIVQKILDQDAENHQHIKFLVKIGDGAFDEIISYNELSNLVEEQHSSADNLPDTVFAFKGILDHQGPLLSSHKDYKGSSYNLLVLWEDNSETYEPLDILIKDDPISVAKYAQDNDLLDTPGWKRLKQLSIKQDRITLLINQDNLSFKR